jgi:ATP-dependent DNA helicase RecG
LGANPFGNTYLRRHEGDYKADDEIVKRMLAEARWIDRLVPDSTWSENLYDFFQKVYRKLTADIKIPFRLREGMRTDDTPVHESIREALTNTLIHADYTGRVSVLVVKRPDMFGFRNPGLMRITVEQAVHGGISDCRNRRIQDMFRYVGLGDHAGSGISKIYRNWNEQHWRLPLLFENQRYEQTLLELRMISLLPEESIRMLDELFGAKFRRLPELERVILITAATEEFVQHTRIKEISLEHSKDISSALAHLVQQKMLVKEGETRGSVYHLPGKQLSGATQLFLDNMDINSPDLGSNSPDLKNNAFFDGRSASIKIP